MGGFTPFNYDVTDELKEGENFVILKVDNKRHAENVPTQIFDWWNYGGITRDVLLIDVAPTYVENYCLRLASTEVDKRGTRPVTFSVKLNAPIAMNDNDRFASGKGNKFFCGVDENGAATRNPYYTRGKAGVDYHMVAMRFEIDF